MNNKLRISQQKIRTHVHDTNNTPFIPRPQVYVLVMFIVLITASRLFEMHDRHFYCKPLQRLVHLAKTRFHCKISFAHLEFIIDLVFPS